MKPNAGKEKEAQKKDMCCDMEKGEIKSFYLNQRRVSVVKKEQRDVPRGDWRAKRKQS